MDAVKDASRIIWASLRESRSLSPRAQAEAAHYVGGPSVDELERDILVSRAMSSPVSGVLLAPGAGDFRVDGAA